MPLNADKDVLIGQFEQWDNMKRATFSYNDIQVIDYSIVSLLKLLNIQVILKISAISSINLDVWPYNRNYFVFRRHFSRCISSFFFHFRGCYQI